MKHYVFSNDGLYFSNYLFKNGQDFTDFYYEYKPENFTHLSYLLKRINFEENNLCFHIDLNACSKRTFIATNFQTYLNGVLIYYEIKRYLKVDHKVNFVFYSFLSIQTLKNEYPILIPDLEQNNFIRLPISNIDFKSLTDYKSSPEYCVNLLRGKYIFLKDTPEHNYPIASFLKDKKILVIDDEFEKFKEIYSIVLGCNNLKGIFKPSEINSIINGLIENETFDGMDYDLIISDLYLTENHKEYNYNLSNAKDISGIKFINQLFQINPSFKETPLIFLTTSTKVWNYQLVEDFNNFQGWIPKPLSDNVLIDSSVFKATYALLYNTLYKLFNNQ